MFIEHIAIYSDNVERLKDFYVKYFGATPGIKYYNIETRFKSYFLSFENGPRLELMQNPHIDVERPEDCKGLNHFTFKLGSKQAVDDLARRLSDDGQKIRKGPRLTGDGYYECCIYDPDYNEIELTE